MHKSSLPRGPYRREDRWPFFILTRRPNGGADREVERPAPNRENVWYNTGRVTAVSSVFPMPCPIVEFVSCGGFW